MVICALFKLFVLSEELIKSLMEGSERGEYFEEGGDLPVSKGDRWNKR